MNPAPDRVLVLATCTAVTFLYSMSLTAVNVSLPQIQGALSATPDQLAWVITSNLVATAVMTPLTGWLAVRFGERRLCLACVGAFAAASAACGLSGSIETLVAWRTVQGAAGAPLVPMSQAIVLASYPRERHGAVISVFGVASVMGPVVGPVLGGALAEAYDWRMVFYMMVPFAAVAFGAVWLFIRDPQAPQPVRLDWTGFLMLSAALAGLQLMLDRGERADWFDSGEIIAYGVLAAVALYAFVVHSATAEQPFLRPALLRDRNFTIGLVLIFVFGMLNFTPMSLLPPLLQGVSGYPDSVIGFVLGARGLGTLVAFFLMIFASRFDPRAMIALGFLLQAFAGWQLTQLDMNPSAEGVFWPMALQGLGVGVLWVPITMVSFSTLGPEHVSEGSAVFHMVRNIGSSVHISLSIALAVHMTRTGYAELAERVTPYSPAASMPWINGAWNLEDLRGLSGVAREMARQATMLGYLDAFVFFIATSLVVLPLVLLIRDKR